MALIYLRPNFNAVKTMLHLYKISFYESSIDK
jgi:hypothetical protein